MDVIRQLQDDDWDVWQPLWAAYLDFYRTSLSEGTTRSTFDRLTRGAHDMFGLLAVGTTALRTLESAALEGGGFRSDWMDTRLFILPGYRFKAVDGLLTNFHQPRSTLLPLVAAFWERQRLLDLYRSCLDLGYRFLSYGDACLFL